LRAVVLNANKSLVIEDRATTELDEDKCRISLHATGVCSSDISRSCENGAYNYPLVMGHEMAGNILQTGSKVEVTYQPGDRVAVFPLLPCFDCEPCHRHKYAQCLNYNYLGSRSDGGYAENIDVSPWNLIAIPDGVTMDDAALTEPTAVVVHSADLLEIEANSKILIIGAGFLGLLALQIFRNSSPDAHVTILDRNPHKLEIARKLGGDTLLIDGPWGMVQHAENLDGQFDRVLEATGSTRGYSSALQMCARGGVVVWMGNISGDLEITQSAVSQILRRELTIKGAWNSTYDSSGPSDWTSAIELMDNGLKPSGLVSHFIALEDLPDALIALYENKLNPKGNSPVKYLVQHQRRSQRIG
jgi:L-iditol 2-dehydrogenase